jgi:hypothetical protein
MKTSNTVVPYFLIIDQSAAGKGTAGLDLPSCMPFTMSF